MDPLVLQNVDPGNLLGVASLANTLFFDEVDKNYRVAKYLNVVEINELNFDNSMRLIMMNINKHY